MDAAGWLDGTFCFAKFWDRTCAVTHPLQKVPPQGLILYPSRGRQPETLKFYAGLSSEWYSSHRTHTSNPPVIK